MFMPWTRVRGITTPSVIGRSVRHIDRREWPGSSLALASCPVAEPRTRITCDPAWSAGAVTAILTASPPRRYRAERSPRYPRAGETGSRSVVPVRLRRKGTWSRSVTSAALSSAHLQEPPWQQNRQIGIPHACTDQARREVKNRRSVTAPPAAGVTEGDQPVAAGRAREARSE